MRINRFMHISSEIPVASMSDIAFLLIVFFMIVAVFSIEAGFSLRLPAKDQPPLRVSDNKIIEVEILRDNTLHIAGETIGIEALASRIDRQGMPNGSFVAIKADPKSQYRTAVLVIEQFKRRGFDKIALKRLKP